MAERGRQLLACYILLDLLQRVILTASQVDQVSHPDLVPVGHIAELGTDRDESLIVDAVEALLGENDRTVAASSREAVMERQADGLAGVVSAEAILVDEVVLQLLRDVVPDLGASGTVCSGLWRAHDPGSQDERDESSLCKHLCGR